MGLNLNDKKAVVAEVAEKVSAAQTIVLAEYRGIQVGDLTKLRAKARSEGGVHPQPFARVEIQQRALAAIVNEALLVLEDDIAARPSDIDLVLINGYGFVRHGSSVAMAWR